MSKVEINPEEIGAEIKFREDGTVESALLPSGGELLFDENGDAELLIPDDIPESEKKSFEEKTLEEYQNSVKKMKHKMFKLNQKEEELKTAEAGGKGTKRLEAEVESLKNQLAEFMTTIQNSSTDTRSKNNSSSKQIVSDDDDDDFDIVFFKNLSKKSGVKITSWDQAEDIRLENPSVYNRILAQSFSNNESQKTEQKFNDYKKSIAENRLDEKVFSEGYDPKIVKDWLRSEGQSYSEFGFRAYKGENKKSNNVEFVNNIVKITKTGIRSFPSDESKTNSIKKELTDEERVEIMRKNLQKSR